METYKSLFGPHVSVAHVVWGDDGERQRAKYDQYVVESDKPYIKIPHATLGCVLAFITTHLRATVSGRSNTASRTRKYTAACVLRDFVNKVVNSEAGRQRMIAFPLGNIVLPFSETRRLLQTRDFLDQIEGGSDVIDFWYAVLAQDPSIPVDVFSNPVL